MFTDAASLVAWIVGSGGAGVVAYWVVGQLDKNTKVGELQSQWKRFLAIAIAVVIGALIAYLGSLVGVYDAPEAMSGWTDLIVSIGLASAAVQQTTHGFIDLPKDKEDDA